MRLTIDARARRILRRLPVITVYSAAELALMAGLAVQCARLIWVAVAPVTPLGAWRPAAIAPAGANGDILRSFDPFFRLESSRNRHTGGIGLGLSSVRGVARAHGGDATIANHPDGGAIARVTLPV